MRVVTTVLNCGILLSVMAFVDARAADTKNPDVGAKGGKELFYSLCASCHGATARGDGPVAKVLVAPPSDLTRIAARNGGKFEADKVRRYIDGREEQRAHGPRDMPVWGRMLYFSAKENDAAARAHADDEIAKIVEYLRALQRP